MWTTQKFLLNSVVVTSILATLIISPSFAYDPINLPKMLVVVTGAFLMVIPLIHTLKNLVKIDLVFIICKIFFAISLLFAFFSNSISKSQQLWGVWGRSTGLLTYLSFLIVMSVGLYLGISLQNAFVRSSFERLSYAITIYTLLQAGQLDPINWSQKFMVATLGNINFMSSFLGFAAISFFSRTVIEKLAFPTKLFYVSVMFINLYLIWISGSIQGIAVFAAGATLAIMFQARIIWNYKSALIWLASVVPVGIVLFIGTLGWGPFSILRQQTVIFRRDYWLAGISMTWDNWLDGVGIDSYGDYYERYRDRAAVLRTGPERVANTAHNIFLDVSSGAGLIAGLLFATLFILSLYGIMQILKQGNFDSTFIGIASMFVGFVIFCLISINQIGVGIWGFLFMGYVRGAYKRLSKSQSEGKVRLGKSSAPSSNLFSVDYKITPRMFLGSVSCGFIGLYLTLLPNITDARFLNSIKTSNFTEMREVVGSFSASTFHRDKYMTLLLDNKRESDAYEFASEELKRNPRDQIALRIIAYSDLASKERRREALLVLKSRDPNNYELVSYINELLKKL